MAERCELYRSIIEGANTRSFSVARPPYWPKPQSWDKGELLKALSTIIEAAKRDAENPDWRKRDIGYEIYQTSLDNFIWVENAYFVALEMKKVQVMKEKVEI